jgi:tRNA(Ile)-lysidine synthase
MEKRVLEYISKHRLVREGLTVGAAVSGGADSMALLVCLKNIAGELGISLNCVHFEHGIRGEESLKDAEFVAEYCERYGILFYMGAADVPALADEWKVSLELAAKRAREEYFAQAIHSGVADVIATAHHEEDTAESVLMHVFRGTGIDGLTGIKQRHGQMIRPFLCVRKKEILEYCNKNGVPYVEDSTNSDNRFTRNYVRNVLIPAANNHLGTDIVPALNRLGEIAQRDAAYLNGCAQQAFEACAAVSADMAELDIAQLIRLDDAIASRVIRLACKSLHVMQDVEYAHVEAVLRLAKKAKTGSKANLTHDLFAEVEYDRLLIGRIARQVDYSFLVEVVPAKETKLPNGAAVVCEIVPEYVFNTEDRFTEYFDLDQLPERMVCRTRQAGDVIHPLNGPGQKKLKDYFIDKKLPRSMRDQVPLLACGSEIIWAIGHVINDQYRVGGQTKRVMKVTYKKVAEENL